MVRPPQAANAAPVLPSLACHTSCSNFPGAKWPCPPQLTRSTRPCRAHCPPISRSSPAFSASPGRQSWSAGPTSPAPPPPSTACSFPPWFCCPLSSSITPPRACPCVPSRSSLSAVSSSPSTSRSITLPSCKLPPPTPPCLATTLPFSSACSLG